MSDIEWTDETWNPVVGCREISPGCRNCYAAKLAHRGLAPQHKGLTVVRADGPHWNGEHRFVADALDKPLRWKKARKVFPCSMSDLFRDEVSDEEIAAVFGVMAVARQHTFQVLTKRPERMVQWFERLDAHEDQTAATPLEQCLMASADHVAGDAWERALERAGISEDYAFAYEEDRWPHVAGDSWERALERAGISEDYAFAYEEDRWPLPNVWIGTTVEDQQRAEERLPHLLQVPAVVRFVSYEPALGPVDFSPWMPPPLAERIQRVMSHRPFIDPPVQVKPFINWLIVGGESGSHARPFDLAWARTAVAQCKAAGVPVFFKQAGASAGDGHQRIAFTGKGGDLEEIRRMAPDLAIREWPHV